MSVSVHVTDGRNFHWESASKPALSRCHYHLPPVSLPHIHHHHHHHHRLHHHHRPRRRHFSGESPPPPWPRRSSEGGETTVSIASSWHAGDNPPESFRGFRGSGLSSSTSSSSSTLSSRSFSYSAAYSPSRLSATEGSFGGSKPPALLLSRDNFVATRRMATSAGGPRSATLEATGNNNNNNTTSTAAAREVKQYLNRTLFPRPSSTLHGYASLYQRLKKLPGSHRKARQRGKTAPPLDASGISQTPGMVSCKQLEETSPPMTESELDDYEDPLEVPLRTPPRVEIHIYVPTGTALNSSGGHYDDDIAPHHYTTP